MLPSVHRAYLEFTMGRSTYNTFVHTRQSQEVALRHMLKKRPAAIEVRGNAAGADKVAYHHLTTRETPLSAGFAAPCCL